MENPNTDGQVSPCDEPMVSTQFREQPEPQAVVWPSLLGPAEILILLVGAIELVTLPFCDPSPSTLRAVGIGCSLSLPSMLAAWSSIRLGAWRYSLTVFLSLLNGFLLTWFANPDFDILLVLLPLASALPVLLTLFVIKRFFGHFAPLASDTGQFLEGLRFNLSHLFVVTTLLAILFAIGKFFWPMLSGSSGYPGEIVVVLSLSALISFNTLMYVWALLGKHAIVRICVVIPIGLGTLVACTMICTSGPQELIWYVVTGLPLISAFVLMAAFRFSGWRFFRGATA